MGGQRRTVGRAAPVAVATGLAAVLVATPLPFIADDALFYVVIGRNVAGGSGLTFSEVMPTNGFQPLWQVLVATVVAAARAVGLDAPLASVHAVVAAYCVTAVVGVAVLDRLIRTLGSGRWGRLLAALLSLAYLLGPTGAAASEAALVLLTLSGALLAVHGVVTSEQASHGRLAVTGALLGVVMLARVDTVFTAGAAVLAVCAVGPAATRTRLRRALVVGAVASAVVAPYLTWNLLRFGHVLPIAGAIKLDGLRPGVNPSALGPSAWVLLAIAVGTAAVVRPPPSHPVTATWAVPVAGAVLATAFYVTFSPGRFTDLAWYRVPHLVAAGIGVALATTRLRRWRSRPVAVVGALGLAACLVLTAHIVTTRRLAGPNRELADDLTRFGPRVDAVLPEGAVVATVDYPGYVALFGRRSTVALDGLTGDYDFQDALRDEGGPCALGERGVTHLVTITAERLRPRPGHPGDQVQDVASWLHDEPAGEVVLAPDDLVLADPASGLSLWRVRLPCTAG